MGLPSGCHRTVAGTSRAEVSGDRSILPLRQGALHQGGQEVLRVGERQGSVQVQVHDSRAGERRVAGQQLLDEVGGLSSLLHGYWSFSMCVCACMCVCVCVSVLPQIHLPETGAVGAYTWKYNIKRTCVEPKK